MDAVDTEVPNLECMDRLPSELIPLKRECKIMGECVFSLDSQPTRISD